MSELSTEQLIKNASEVQHDPNAMIFDMTRRLSAYLLKYGEIEECDHDKVHALFKLQIGRPWICVNCFAEGHDSRKVYSGNGTIRYREIKEGSKG